MKLDYSVEEPLNREPRVKNLIQKLVSTLHVQASLDGP